MSLSRDITFKQIRAFAAVARTGSITKASEELFVTPPAISSQLKTLQHLVGADIINRESGGLKPTQVGLEILSLFGRVDAAVRSSEQKIGAIKSGKSGMVGVAVVSTGKYFAPNIFAGFMKAYPGIELKPLIGNRQVVLEALRNKSVDIVIMGRPPAKLDVIAHELGDHPNIIIAPPDHPLAQGQKINPHDLLAETLLTREFGSGTRTLAIRYMDRIGNGRGYPKMTVGSNESIKQSVMAGLGIAMISEHTCMSELESGRLVALQMPGLPIIRKWIMVHLAGDEISGAAKSFHSFLLENRKDFIPGHL